MTTSISRCYYYRLLFYFLLTINNLVHCFDFDAASISPKIELCQEQSVLSRLNIRTSELTDNSFALDKMKNKSYKYQAMHFHFVYK